MAWLSLTKPGDWLLVLLALGGTLFSFLTLWQGGQGEWAVIRLEGKIFMEIPLDKTQELDVPGPLGTTQIRIEPGRARVIADPGPRQYCVRQGWLSRAGEVALCAPNRVSLAITSRKPAYDTLGY